MVRPGPITLVCGLLAGGALAGWAAFQGCGGGDGAAAEDGQQARVAVEVAPIGSGRIREMRVFAGTLEASAQFRAAAKVGGLVESVTVDLGDTIERDQIVATIDDAEYVQDIVQARGNLAVETANSARAKSMLELAKTERERAARLYEKGLVSQQRVEETSAAVSAAEASVHLARGQVQRAAAALELARIRHGYTEVRANWSGDQPTATVAARHHDPGNTVQPGDPIIDVVSLDPLVCVMSVPERDYARLAIGQKAAITSDTVPGATFEAEIKRIAPVFRESSRQAKVELSLDNAEGKLKPGAFARVKLELGAGDAEAIVPSAAITRRKDSDFVFVLADDGDTVKMRAVSTGIREGANVAVAPTDGEPLVGRVVVLGQQLLDDGSVVRVVEDGEP